MRNIQKKKLYSFINSVGLSVGIAFCILIYLYIQDEKSFDQFHANKELIYRMEEKSFDTWQHDPAKPFNLSAWLQTGLKQALKDDLSEVAYATRFIPDGTGIFKYKDKIFTEKITYTDGDFFKMFSFHLLSGNADRFFENKTDAVITPAVMLKLPEKLPALSKITTPTLPVVVLLYAIAKPPFDDAATTGSILIGTPPCFSTSVIAAERSLQVRTPSISFPSGLRATYRNWGMADG